MVQPPRHHSMMMPNSPTSGTSSPGHSAQNRHSMNGGGGGGAATALNLNRRASTPKVDDEDGGNVKVVIRIRPSNVTSDVSIPIRFQRVALKPIPSNPLTDVTIHLESTPGGGTAASPEKGGKAARNAVFRYDRILTEESGQKEAYEVGAKEAVDKFLKGINVTILAYGQTSSGKSYTMGTTGIDADYDALNATNRIVDGSMEEPGEEAARIGIIPRAVSDVFEKAEEVRKLGGRDAKWECRCSFLELYNEDLIDLLSILPATQSPPITIREDTKGRIVWSGLREVKVSSTQDVMALLKKGSTKRRTGETGMNKESSRSHAIFSLTLTQVKRSGGTASSVSSAAAVAGRSLARPTSFSGIPTHSGMRSPTPTSTRPSSRNSVLLPPSSGVRAVQAASGSGRASPDEANAGSGGQWVELVSKFHFVDLAGSERMKKTGAVGERMKEGIAINSGLTALGNVISALADPVKAKAGLHIPYRDSKLTRLLQDSLGGNAYTIMIACVSPLEYNLSETLNTLRYGQRARSIRNRAEVNQIEVGWDDVEHLQNAVTKLRKELAVIKNLGGAGGKTTPGMEVETGIHVTSSLAIDEEMERQLLRAKMKLANLQGEHDILRQYVQEQHVKTARLTKDYEECKQSGVGEQGPMTFAELVDPIVKEYEQSIEGLESELCKLKAAWTYANDLSNEQEKELLKREQRLQKQDEYVTELKSRITKLTDRENTYEEHTRALEFQVKSYSERSDANEETVGTLRKNLAQAREREQSTSLYIAQLELAAMKTDEEIQILGVKVERLEEELKARDKSYQQMEAKFKLLNTSADVERLMHELDARDKHVAEMEGRLQQALADCTRVATERDRLKAIGGVEAESAAAMHTGCNEEKCQNTAESDASLTDSAIDGMDANVLPKDTSLTHLQQKQARTLAELEEVSSLYHASLQEIARLAGEIEDARKGGSEPEDFILDSPSPKNGGGSSEDLKSDDSVTSSPRGNTRRRGVGARKLSLATQNHNGLPGKDFHGGRGHSNQAASRPQSYSQELSSSESSRSCWAGSGSFLSPIAAQRQSLPMLKSQRSMPSLETEIRQLQDVLKKRDEEIAALEESLRISHGIPSRPVDAVHQYQLQENENEIQSPNAPASKKHLSCNTQPTAIHRLDRNFSSSESLGQILSPTMPYRKRRYTVEIFNGLYPKIPSEVDALRSSLVRGHDSLATSDDLHLRRLNALMRSMARKESAHKEQIEALHAKLTVAQGVGAKTTLANEIVHTDTLERKPLFDLKVPNSQSDLVDPAAKVATSVENDVQHTELKCALQRAECDLSMAVETRSAAQAAATAAETAMIEERAEAQRCQEAAHKYEEQLLTLRTSLGEVLATRHGAAESATDEQHIQTIRAALEEAEAQRSANELSLKELQDKAKALQEAQQNIQQLIAESSLRDATIRALEQRIQDITVNNIKGRELDMDDLTTSPPTSRLSLGRSATPSNGFKYPPPISPPPTIPPPPVPVPALPTISATYSNGRRPSLVEKNTSDTRSSISSSASDPRGNHMGVSPVGLADATAASGQLQVQLEQETMIRTLNKQLLHCENDLQATMDLVSSLETNLSTSERNLRKARTQMQEINKERDSAQAEASRLRQQLEEAHKEVSTVRNSIIVEKRSLEDRLSEERKAKERARAQLEQRLNEVTQQKHSAKFKCF